MPQIMGVIFWICALVTVAANQPEDDLGREGTDPSCAATLGPRGALLPRHCAESSSRTKAGTGTERALRPFVGPTAWVTPS
jgi:hypothetical protein